MKTQIAAFVAALNAAFDDYTFTVEMGRKNARIVQEPVKGAGRSVYCFVRIDDGAILKSASWKAPAKGVRAWLPQVLESGLHGVDQYGGWLYCCR